MESFMLLCKPVVVKGIIKPNVHNCIPMIKRCDSKKCSIKVYEAPPLQVKYNATLYKYDQGRGRI